MSSIVSSVTSISSVFTWDVVNEALDNELILNMIFDNLIDSCHLTVCRLVCSKWNQLIVKQLQKYNWIFRNVIKFENNEKLQDFMNTFASSSQNSHLLFSCFSFEGELNHILLKNFFKTFPQKMKSLILDCRLKDLEQLEDILESQDSSLIELEISPQFENYETFSAKKVSDRKLRLSNLIYLTLIESFDICRARLVDETTRHKHDRLNIELLTWILSKIPVDTNNAKSIKLKIILMKYITLTAAVNSLKMFGFIKNLKMIQISSFEYEDMSILTNAGVELKCLSLALYHTLNYYAEMPPSEAYALLQNQINSLEILKYEADAFKFPSDMRALKILYLSQIHQKIVDDYDLEIPILYHQHFPNLQVLILRLGNSNRKKSSEVSQLFCPQEPCLSLRSLTISYNYLRGEIMRNISSIFPRINALAIKNSHYNRMTDDEENLLYSEIWNSSFAENLEELYLELDEKDINSGYYTEFWHPTHGQHKLNTVFFGFMADEIHSFDYHEFDESNYNSILKLKNLKKLQIICFTHQEHPFTDFSAYYIFGKMKKLQVLHLDEKLRQFTPEALEYLKNKSKTSGTSTLSLAYNIIFDNNLEMYCETDPDYSTFTEDIFNLLC